MAGGTTIDVMGVDIEVRIGRLEQGVNQAKTIVERAAKDIEKISSFDFAKTWVESFHKLTMIGHMAQGAFAGLEGIVAGVTGHFDVMLESLKQLPFGLGRIVHHFERIYDLMNDTAAKAKEAAKLAKEADDADKRRPKEIADLAAGQSDLADRKRKLAAGPDNPYADKMIDIDKKEREEIAKANANRDKAVQDAADRELELVAIENKIAEKEKMLGPDSLYVHWGTGSGKEQVQQDLAKDQARKRDIMADQARAREAQRHADEDTATATQEAAAARDAAWRKAVTDSQTKGTSKAFEVPGWDEARKAEADRDKRVEDHWKKMKDAGMKVWHELGVGAEEINKRQTATQHAIIKRTEEAAKEEAKRVEDLNKIRTEGRVKELEAQGKHWDAQRAKVNGDYQDRIAKAKDLETKEALGRARGRELDAIAKAERDADAKVKAKDLHSSLMIGGAQQYEAGSQFHGAGMITGAMRRQPVALDPRDAELIGKAVARNMRHHGARAA
jgi:hypothetical protein